jgi:hypothetical protein
MQAYHYLPTCSTNTLSSKLNQTNPQDFQYTAEVKKFKIVNLVEQITYEESFLLLPLFL